MILRSGKIVAKRHKHSSAAFAVDTNIARYEIKQNEEEEDIISSRLPDEILTHILSLLPDADVYRTRILSKRWNHLCFFLPFLCFKMPPSYNPSLEAVNKFYDFVDETFSIRNRDMPVIKRFFLSIPYYYDHNRVLGWILIVLPSQHLQTFELRFPHQLDKFSLSWDLLMTRNNALVDLTLKNVDMGGLDETQLLFPCLKKMKLTSRVYPGRSLQNLISACPVLHELCLDVQELHTFEIFLPSLKILRIVRRCDDKADKVVIDAPKLEYFYIREYGSTTYSLANPSSLVEANINKYYFNDNELLTDVSSARILTMGSYSLWGLILHYGFNLPVFHNLVNFIVDFDNIWGWFMLFIFLDEMPNLQHLTILFGHHSSPLELRRHLPTEAPNCLRLTVKEIVIHIENVVQVKDLVDLIRYLVILTLNTNDIDRETREELLKIRRNSKSCQIEFI